MWLVDFVCSHFKNGDTFPILIWLILKVELPGKLLLMNEEFDCISEACVRPEGFGTEQQTQVRLLKVPVFI